MNVSSLVSVAAAAQTCSACLPWLLDILSAPEAAGLKLAACRCPCRKRSLASLQVCLMGMQGALVLQHAGATPDALAIDLACRTGAATLVQSDKAADLLDTKAPIAEHGSVEAYKVRKEVCLSHKFFKSIASSKMMDADLSINSLRAHDDKPSQMDSSRILVHRS